MWYQEIILLRIQVKKVTNEYYNSKIEDEKIAIDDQLIQRSRVDLIALKVLDKCNVSSKKNKNNNTRIKNGEGKLMITNGLSVKEFEKKYRLNLQ